MLTAICFFLALTAVYGQTPMDEESALSPMNEESALLMCEPSTKEEFECMQEFDLAGNPYFVHWTVDGTLLQMALEATTTGWVGFAFAGEPGQMVPSDFIIGWVDGDSVSVLPYFSEARSITETNEEGDIELMDVRGEEEDGVTTIYFTRDTAQEGNVPIDLEMEVDINFAVGPEDELVYHQTNRASGVISFI